MCVCACECVFVCAPADEWRQQPHHYYLWSPISSAGLKPKVICGHGPFSLSLSALFYSSSLSSHPHLPFSLVISCCAFFSPLVRPVASSLPHNPKPCPPLTLCLLSVNSFFLFLVCWPRLTYSSLSLSQLSLSRSLDPSLWLSPSVSLVPFHLPSPSLREAQNRLHMCTHVLYNIPCMHRQREVRTHLGLLSCYHDEVIPRVQSDRSL